MLTSVHFLLTYSCNYECDHCFLFCSPKAEGTFTLDQIRRVINDIKRIDTMESIYFEGGEPFLYYPLMLEGIKLAHEAGFRTGIVTNSYWGLTVEDASLWLKPISELGISDLSVSDDLFHHNDEKDNPAKNAQAAAEKLGIPVGAICLEKPAFDEESSRIKGEPVIGGGVLLKGRAVENLTDDLPRWNYKKFAECTAEELKTPRRIHLDSYGYAHICQGLVMGNTWETSLYELDKTYNAEKHPICGPLLEGGPALLAEKYNVNRDEEYVSACHLCYLVRKELISKFPDYLAPEQVYGFE